FRTAAHRDGEARALSGIAWYQALLGEHEQAVACGEQALALLGEGDPHWAAGTWDTIGYAHQHLGHHTEAAACYERALALNRATGDRHSEALVLTHVGDARHAAGAAGDAIDAWRDALAILDDPGAAGLRARLT